MDNQENFSIEPVPQPVRVYEGEVIEKTHTWEDVRRSWSELRQTWIIGLERIRAAMEERARLRNAAMEHSSTDTINNTETGQD